MTLKFHYFDGFYAKGDAIRMILAKGKVAWEDNRIAYADWPNHKASMPNGQVPAIELEDGTKRGESKAIIRYVAMKNGFYPDDPWEAAVTDEAIDTWSEILAKTYPPAFAQDEETKAKLIDACFEAHGKFLKAFDAQFAKGFLCGDKLTAGDFCLGSFYTNYYANPSVGFAADRWKALLDEHPNFKAYGEKFAAELADYLSTRPSYAI